MNKTDINTNESISAVTCTVTTTTTSTTALTCQLLLQPFDLLVQLLDLFVSGQSSSSSRGLQGLGRLYTARGQRSEQHHSKRVRFINHSKRVCVCLTLQFAIQLLFLLLQPADPPLERLHLLPSSSTLLRLQEAKPHPADGAAVGEAAAGGEGEADEGEMLTSETSVRHRGGDVLQGKHSVRTTQTGLRRVINGNTGFNNGQSSSPGS